MSSLTNVSINDLLVCSKFDGSLVKLCLLNHGEIQNTIGVKMVPSYKWVFSWTKYVMDNKSRNWCQGGPTVDVI
jgi:hypothetical protein